MKRGCMIAGSDRACVPLLYFALRFDSPDDGSRQRLIVGAPRQSRPVMADGFAV